MGLSFSPKLVKQRASENPCPPYYRKAPPLEWLPLSLTLGKRWRHNNALHPTAERLSVGGKDYPQPLNRNISQQRGGRRNP